MINYTYMESPVGRLLLAGDEEGLQLIGFAEGKNQPQPESGWRYHTEPLRGAVGQLSDYFAGNRRSFNLPLQLRGTPFQLTVWRALQDIPYGQTISYGELARRIGNPKASRGRAGQWIEPHPDCRSMSSRDWQQRQADRLRRWVMPQGDTAGAGAKTRRGAGGPIMSRRRLLLFHFGNSPGPLLTAFRQKITQKPQFCIRPRVPYPWFIENKWVKFWNSDCIP